VGAAAVGPRPIYVPPFRIDLEVRPGVARLVPAAELARVLHAALTAGGAPEPASVGLILAGDAELAALNRAHMGKEGPTDVLSFPLLPPAAFPSHSGGPSVAGRGAPDPAGRAYLAGAGGVRPADVIGRSQVVSAPSGSGDAR